MSTVSGYPIRSFSENQTFLVYDPSSSTTSRVRGSDLIDYITPNLNVVRTESTTSAAVNEDYKVGSIVQTAGDTSPGDGGAGLFLVVPSGDGDVTMLNGNELLTIAGDAFLRTQLNDGIVRFDSLSEMGSTAGRFDADAGRLVSGTGRDGDFRWNATDLSGTLILSSVTSTSVDSGTDTITSAGHGLVDGNGVVTTTAVNGLTANQVYWVVGATTDTFQLSETFGGAAVDLTGTTSFTIQHLLDPLQGVYVTASGDPTGIGGSWVRQDTGEVTPYMFGAIGDGATDDTQALQKFFDYDESYAGICNWYGEWGISSGIYWGGGHYVNLGIIKKNVAGKLTCLSSMEIALRVYDQRYAVTKNRIWIEGTGGDTYPSRTVSDGIEFNFVGSAKFDGYSVRNVKRWGGYTTTGVNGNSIFCNFGRINGWNCGSAPSTDSADWAKRFNFTARTDTGSANSVNQRSVLTLDESPKILQVGTPVRIGLDFYVIEDKDDSAQTISLFPWVTDTLATTGIIHSMHGGAFRAFGNNLASSKVAGINALRCGSALSAEGLYGPCVDNIVSQVTGVTLFQKGLNYGLVVDNFHPETPVDFCVDYLKADYNASRTVISGISVIRESEIKGLIAKNTSGVEAVGQAVGGVTFNLGEYEYRREQATYVRAISSDISNSPENNYLVNRNRTDTAVTISVDQDLVKAFNYTYAKIERWGDSASSTPGSTTISVSSADAALGITINGGSSITVKSYPYHYTIKLAYDPIAEDWRVGVFPSVDPAAV